MEWCKEIEIFSKVATAEPQAAYAAFMFELRHCNNYFMRTMLKISSKLQEPKDCIGNCLIRTLFSGYECNDKER